MAQFKAKNNIQISKYNNEICSHLEKLEAESSKLDLKFREFHQRSKADDEINTKNDEIISRTPSKNIFSSKDMLHGEIIKELSCTLLPPSLSAKEIRPRNESFAHKGNKVCFDSTSKNYLDHDNKKKLNRKMSENSKSLSHDCLKLKLKEKTKIPKFKQSMYHDLLKQKYGFIQPRLK